jgi:HPt (histidine-containing phosphotransfer) domain-containing protein
MPEIDGYQLTAAIRVEEGEHGAVRKPIIAITANALKGEAEHCRAVGMDDYLSKPVQLSHLKAVLQKWLPSPASAELLELAPPGSTAPSATATPAAPATPMESATTGAPAPSTVAAKPVDVSILEQLVGNDPAVISEFLQDFRVSARKTADELRAACQAGDAKTAGSIAHKLKSSARSVGALQLGELCAQMEQAGKAGDMTRLNEILPSFESESAAVDKYIGSLA